MSLHLQNQIDKLSRDLNKDRRLLGKQTTALHKASAAIKILNDALHKAEKIQREHAATLKNYGENFEKKMIAAMANVIGGGLEIVETKSTDDKLRELMNEQ